LGYYDLNKEERIELVKKIRNDLFIDFKSLKKRHIIQYYSDTDTYIRKAAYESTGVLYKTKIELQKNIITLLDYLFEESDASLRQTVINAAGEIGITEFEKIEHLLEKGIFDSHHSVRNAVIGSIKKMGAKNPRPVLKFAGKYLHHEDKEVRREICHGIELLGRTKPMAILPLLKELQYDDTSRVRKTLIHVIGQISYKKGCLEIVIHELIKWENKEIVSESAAEIISVHKRYSNFAYYTTDQAIEYIRKYINID
jgi:HEAT repeat protein